MSRGFRVLGVALVAVVAAGGVALAVGAMRRGDPATLTSSPGAVRGGASAAGVDRAAAAVVRVVRTLGQATPGAFPGDRWPGATGVVVDPRGYVLTAQSVVAGASRLGVELPGGRAVDALVIGSDPLSAVTLLKVEAAGLSAIALAGGAPLDAGSSTTLLSESGGSIARTTLAVGSAHHSLTLPDPATPARDPVLNDLLALPAGARGEVGAPLVDAAGQLAGILVADGMPSIAGSDAQAAYAADITDTAPQLQQLIDSGHLTYPSLGFDYEQLTSVEARERGVAAGVLLVRVAHGSAAESAHLAAGDVVTTADGTLLDPSHSLRRILRNLPAHQGVAITVRGPRSQRVVTLPLQLESA